MRLSASEKPRLIVIEGPAGVGKTTLTQHLSQRLAARGISTLALREFSDSPLGIALEDSSYYGQARPPWVLGVGGTVAFLADKLKLLETAAEDRDTVYVSDRFVVTQLILGLRSVKGECEKKLTTDMISTALAWIELTFSDDSIVVILEADLQILRQRLEQRVGRKLTTTELRLLSDEICAYAGLEPNLVGWTRIKIHSTKPLESIASDLVSRILPIWKT